MQRHLPSTRCTPEPSDLIVIYAGSVELREGAIPVCFLVGALAAVIRLTVMAPRGRHRSWGTPRRG